MTREYQTSAPGSVAIDNGEQATIAERLLSWSCGHARAQRVQLRADGRAERRPRERGAARAAARNAARRTNGGRMSDRYRIVVLGLTITSSWGNGHATTY